MHAPLRPLALLFLGWIVAGCGEMSSPAPDASSAGDPVSHVVASPAEAAPTQDYPSKLKTLDSERAKRQSAAARMSEARLHLRVFRQRDWDALLAANREAFQALRQKAAASPTHTVACTLCDGRGVMGTCLLCKHSGKCVDCDGTGRSSGEEYCPTCLGNGKCYLCFGGRKMTCPYCDDGVMSLKVPPPTSLPVD